MATRTMVRTRVTTTNRRFDAVYDPLYTSPQNQPKAAPRQQPWVSHARDAVRGAVTAKALPTSPAAPQVAATVTTGTDAQVLGPDRHKYFRRPVLPYQDAVVLEPQAIEPEAKFVAEHKEQEQEEPKTRDAEVQTMFRESEAQTDPWSADYVVDEDGPAPEVLGIAHLTYAKGLPASMAEVTEIQRLRDKRAFEASLPEATDEASFQRRKKMLEERELLEWKQQEAEMQKEQDEKLNSMMTSLRQRDMQHEMLSDARIDMVRQGKEKVGDKVQEKIYRERVKVLRALTKHRMGQDKKEHKRDVIGEHANFASKVYAPIMREGRVPLKNEVIAYNIPLINDYQGLESLEGRLPKSLTHTQTHQPINLLMHGFQTRKAKTIAGHLQHIDDLLHKGPEQDTPALENKYKKFEPLVRAPTPVVEAPPDEEQDRAVLLLQRLIRGRAVQNEMYAGKQKTRQLIHELRLAAEPPLESQSDKDQAQAEEHAIDALIGEVMSGALDFIAKEVVRVSEEKQIAELVANATRTRRVREAEESGRRKAEYIVRKKQEQERSEIMSVHHATADRFLNTLFGKAVEATAEKQARAAAVAKAREVDAQTEHKPAEHVVHDLLSAFVLPEVERRKQQNHDDVRDQRFMHAAKFALTAAVDEVVRKTAENAKSAAPAAGGRSR